MSKRKKVALVSLLVFLFCCFLCSGGFLILNEVVLQQTGMSLIPSAISKNFMSKKDLSGFENCDDLQAKFREYAKEQEERDRNIMYEMEVDMALPNAGVQEDSAGSKESASPSYHTETNVQVEGIDEADTVKSDGKRLFVMKNGGYDYYSRSRSENKIVLMEVYPFETARKLSEITFEEGENPQEMFIYGEKLVVFTRKTISDFEDPIYREESEGVVEEDLIMPTPYRYTTFSVTRIYDVSDMNSPKLEDSVEVEGDYLTSRLKNGFVYMVSNEYDYADWLSPIPLYRANDGEYKSSCGCEDISILNPDDVYPKFTTVLTLDLKSGDFDPEFKNYIGNTNTVYMSHGSIYLVSQPMYYWGYMDNSGDRTLISKVDYTDGELSYKDGIEFNGHLLNQFSLDENDGFLRVAGTYGSMWQGDSQNYLKVFDENMDQIAEIEDLAKGEKIYSARFYGDIGVIVTFKKVDPLFVFDLSDNKNPKLKGALKIPGYSDYLHFIDENTVLGFGKETVEAKDELKEGRGLDFAWYQGLKMATFDISNMEDPKEISKLIIGDRGSESEALKNHKAFTFDQKNRRIIIPALVSEVDTEKCQQRYSGEYDVNSCQGDPVSQGAQVIELKDDNTLKLVGEISHFETNSRNYSNYADEAVSRSMVIEDVLLTISEDQVRLNNLFSLEYLDKILLDD